MERKHLNTQSPKLFKRRGILWVLGLTAMATAVLQPSDVGDVGLEGLEVEQVEQVEQERVLGASTADQVLERWHGFMAETSKLLKSQLEPPAWRYRLPLSRLTVTTPTTSQVLKLTKLLSRTRTKLETKNQTFCLCRNQRVCYKPRTSV